MIDIREKWPRGFVVVRPAGRTVPGGQVFLVCADLAWLMIKDFPVAHRAELLVCRMAL